MKYIRRQATDSKSAIQTTVIRKRLLFTFIMVVALGGVTLGLTTIQQVSAQLEESTKAFVETKRDKSPVQHSQKGMAVSQLQINYHGNPDVTEALQSRLAEPRILASADLNGDAAPDLIAGYMYNAMGIVTIQLGNSDAFAPKDDSVFGRMQKGYNPDSLLPTAETVQVPEPVDFLQVGDFNQDSRPDVLFAAHGGNLYLLAGDGQGRFAEPEQIALPGKVTALAGGEFRAVDGRMDVAVGVNGEKGFQVLIFDGALSLFNSEPIIYDLPSQVLMVEFGELDSDPFMDLAVLVDREIFLIHGWGRKTSLKIQSQMERVNISANICRMALGHFIWDREGRKELAALSTDGTVSILQPDGLDTRPFTEDELLLRNRGRFESKGDRNVDVEALQGWTAVNSATWNTARTVNTSAVVSEPYRQALLTKTNMASRENDDILVSGSSGLSVIRQMDPQAIAEKMSQGEMIASSGDMAELSLSSSDDAAAVLQLPQKLNGERNLVVLQAQSSPMIVALVPTSITVDRTDDPSGASLPAASVCNNAVANDCSLRGAVQFANIAANSPATINLPAGTYVLSTNGTNAVGCDGNTVGDLGLNQSMNIVGAGAATTIIRQTGTGPANDGDRIMCMNEVFSIQLVYSYSGVSFVGGREGTAAGTGSAIGGAGIIGGELDNSLTLTNVVMANNQETVSGSGNAGGGALQITGGNLIITNSTFGGTSAPGAYTDRTSTNTGNTQAGSGGGITFTPSSPMHMGGTGTLTVSGTTFSRNTASGIGGGGADLLIIAFASPGGIGSGTASIGTSTFSNNQALGTASGGGIIVESLATTVATTSLTNNSAGNRGGGIFVAGASLLLNGTTPSITFTGNTATSGGSSVSTSAAVNVDGTNTSIGGDIQIATGATWTNNAGSTLAPTNVVMTGGTFNMNNSTMNVGGNMTIGPGAIVGATFNGNSGTVNIQGNFVLNAGGAPATTLNAGTGTFNFNGTGAQSITNGTSITFFNLTDSNTTQQLTLNNSFNVNGTLNINGANATLNPVAAAVIGGTGTLTGSGTARVTRTAATPDFFTQYSITNKTLTNLLVDYVGISAQTISGTTYSRLRLNNASGATLGGNVTVNSTLFLTAGTMNVGTNTLTINNGITVGSGGLASSATGTVNYNQSSDGQSVLAANYGNLTFSNFNKVLAGSGTIGVAGTFTPGTAVGHTITGSTFNFNGAGAQTIPIFSYNNLTVSGARGGANITLPSGTINILGTFSPTATTVNYITAGNTINFNGTGAQSVPAFNYNNLTVSGARGGAAVTFANGGTVGVAGTFSPTATSVNFITTGNTFDFNGTGAQSVPAFSYNNLTISGARGGNTVTFTGTIGIAGIFNPSATSVVYGIAGTTFVFNGTAAQTLPSNFTTYDNLTLNNPAGVTGFAGLTVQGLLRIQQGTFTSSSNYKDVQIDSGATLAGINATTINVSGNWTNNGTFTANGNTVVFNGLAAQSIGGSSTTTFNNLTINNAAGVNLNSNVTVGGTLSLANGAFAVGSNTLTLNSAVVITGGSLSSSSTGTINYNQSSNGQAVLALNYGNLIFSNFNKILPNGTIGVAGTFTPGTATGHTITGNTFDFNGTGAQTVPGFNYNNLTVSGARGGNTVTFTGSIGIAGIFNPSATSVVYSTTGSTFTFNGSAAQTIPVFNYENLALNNSAGASLGGNVTVGGSLALTSGNLAVGTNTLIINGAASQTAGTLSSAATGTVNYNQGTNGQTVVSANYGNLTFSNFNKDLTNKTIGIAGTFTSGTATGHVITGSTFIFNGTSAQVLPSGFTTYNNLTLNNPAGVTGFAGLIVQGLLRVQQGIFTASGSFNNVQIDSGATLAGTNATTMNVGGNWTNNGTFTNNTNTVNFNGTSAQAISGANVFNNLTINNAAGVNLNASATVDGTFTLTNGTFAIGTNTLTLNGTVSQTGGAISSAATGTVNYNQGSDGQAVLTGNYGNLTFSNFNKILPAGTVGIAGTFTTGSATGHAITGNTINFNGTGAQTVPAFSYNNLTISGARGGATVTLVNGGTINVAGAFSPTATVVVYSTTGNTFVFNGSGAQTIPAFTFNNLSTATGGTKTLGGAITATGNLTIGAGTTLDASASNFAINLGGNWTNNGVFAPQGGTVTLNGIIAQTVGGSSSTTFNNLTINNASGVSIAVDTTVNGVLTLTNGNINTGTFNLILGGGTSVSRTSGHVIGNIQKTYSSAGSFTFPVGTANGYSPATVNVTAGTFPLGFNVRAVQGAQPALNPANSLQRYWQISPTGGNPTANLALNYFDSDVMGIENSYAILRVSGMQVTSFPNNPPIVVIDTTNNVATINGVTSFSDWTLGTALPPTAANATVAGKVVTVGGIGVYNAEVVIVDRNGQSRRTRTNPFGYFRFDSVPSGATYVINVRHKEYGFEPQILNVNDDVTEFIIVAR